MYTLLTTDRLYATVSNVARGERKGLSPPIGLKSMQNHTFLELLRPIFAQKMKTAPFSFFFWRSTCFWAETLFEFPISAKKSISILNKTNENSGQGHLQLSHSFKTPPPLF